jgi:hypothetical protein
LKEEGLLPDAQEVDKKDLEGKKTNDFVLTYQKAIDPLNIFYRREIKKAK